MPRVGRRVIAREVPVVSSSLGDHLYMLCELTPAMRRHRSGLLRGHQHDLHVSCTNFLDELTESCVDRDFVYLTGVRLENRVRVIGDGVTIPWQARMILQCPPYFDYQTFKSSAVNTWRRNAWGGGTLFVQDRLSSLVDESFLELGWPGLSDE